MNKNLYRIIFNKRRGQLMVVAEHASSQGKAAKGEGEGSLDSGVFEGGGGLNGKLRPLALAMFGALGMVTFVAGPAMGQIVADPSAPGRQRPTVVQSANGVTQVNIQTPSAAGVSRNTYSQFDVTANGAILNNSRGNVQTQTGGWVQGNPWLAGGSARVILNEVNSANPSQLRGYVEVAGQRAEVVIANPAGVAVDGGGFINASRVVLTTGTPILNGGSLDGYMVQRGVVSVNGRGLDTSLSDYTAILARAAQINGGIWAQELKVVTGSNQIDAAHGVAGAASGMGPAPTYALDVAQLGGMYAGKITLVGTEAGLGVRNAGVMAATVGNLVLQANGWLSNSGNIQSAGSGSQVSIAVAGDVANSGTVYAGGDSQVQAQGNIAISGVIGAQGNVGVHATGAAARVDAGAGSVLAAGLKLDNTVSGSGKLDVSAGDTIAVHGTAVAAGDSGLSARQLDLVNAQVSGANVSLGASAGDLDASRAQVSARERLQLDAAHTVRSDAAQLTGQQLAISAHDLSNVGGQLTQLGSGDLAISLPGALDNTRGVIATNSQALRLQAGSLSNQDGQIQHAGTGALEIGAAHINLQRGSILSNGAMALTGEHIDHHDARTVAGQLSINAGTLDNRGGSLAQSGQGATGVQVRGGLDNRGGALESNGALTVQAGHVQNQKGRIVAGGDLAMSTGGLDNTEATMAAGGKLRLDSGDVDNTRGQVQALAGDASLSVAKLNNTAGSVFAGGNLTTQASEVLNSGNLYAAGNQTLQVSGAISNSGVIAAQGNNRVDASRIDSAAGSLLGAGIRADGSLAGSGQLALTATQAIHAYGQNLAAGKTSMQATAIDLSGSQTGGAAIALNASAGHVVTDGALVTTTGLLSVAATGSSQALSNVRGTLSAGQLDITTGSLDNRGGTLIQTGNGDTALQGRTVDNTGGRIAVNSAKLTLTADNVINRDGSIEHAGTGSLHIEAGRFDDERGKVMGNGLVDIRSETIDHRHAVTSGQQVTVQAGQLDNSDGTLQQTGPGQMRVDVAQALDNTRGSIAGNGSVQVQAAVLENSKGRITSAASADIASKGALNNTDGVIAATQELRLAGAGVDNTRGVLQADNLRLDAATLLNQQGTVSAGTDLTARTGGELNNAGLLYAGRNQQLTVGGLLNNSGSIASVNNTHITAGKVTSSGLLGAGVKADGSLGTAGDLTVNADGVLQASGQNLAAGSTLLTGDSIDLSGSQTGAANIAITARSGDVLTNKAVISASNVLAITANATNAQSLVNSQGQLVGGQLQLNVANLDNASGEIVQTGTGDTVITTNKLDNTAGRIAVNSANLALNATVLTNINGKLEHAGAGVLAINAGQFDNQHGKITGNGKLDITAAALDHRNATTVANQLTINAGSLDNRSGSLAQTGSGLMRVNAAGLLDNTGGKIEGNGDALLKASTLLNSAGRIVAAQDAALSVASLDNTEGTVATGRNLALSGGDIDNTKGQLQAVAGNATLTVGKLNNAAGSVFAGGNLNTTLDSLSNTGSLYAAGNQSLAATGTVTNTGVIAAQGNTSLMANGLDSSASSLIGAGIQADGKLGTAGDLAISTTQTLAAHGQVLAAGNANLTGANVDIAGSQTGAANIGLTATTGDVSTNKAVVTTPGALNVTTSATLHNTEGTLQAGQLDLHVGNLDNAKGTILQTGTGDTSIVTGNLDNTAGRIAVNSANVTVDAATLTNRDGKIEHAGTSILNLQVGVLDNSKGRITSAAAASVVSKGTLNNSDGVIAATTDLQVGGIALDNTRGVLQASVGNLTLDASSLLNQQGTVSAGTDLTAKVGGDVNNAGLLYAGRNQQLTVGGALNNSGSIASVGNTTIAAGKVTSSGLLGAGVQADGSLGAAGDLTINADGVLQASGQNLAAGSVVLVGDSVDLSGSQTGAANIAITARSGDVLTNKAVISASNVLAITANATNAQSLVNSQGQLVGGQLQLKVAKLDNASGEIVQTGTGDTVITTNKLDNTAGRIAVNSANLALNATVLTNINGKLEHAGAGVLAINAGRFDNQHGKITGNGKLDIMATALDHRNATTVANQLTVNAGSLDNRSGSLAQTGSGLMRVNAAGLLDNTGGKIEGNGDALLKASTLLNSAGRIVTAQDAALNVASLDNTEGTVAAGRHLQLSGGDIDNTKGQLQAVVGDATLTVGKLTNAAGSVFAGGNLNTTLDSLSNTGSLYAAGNQSLAATGTVTNTGVIAAQGNTSLTANGLDSSASSLIGAGMQADGKLGTTGDLAISTTQTLAAHGQVLAAGNANLTGANVDIAGSQTGAANIGLTATMGDVSTNKAVVTTPGALNITTNATLHNTEGTVQAGQLDLHVGNLDNAKGTILQTGSGDTRIVTGNLDNTAGRIAVNSKNLHIDAVSATNKDGKIEHAGTGVLTLQAGVLDNSKGRITSAASADIASKGTLNNTDGVMAATANLHVGGVNIDNTRGVLQGDNLRLDAATLLNQQGTVSAGADLTAKVSADLNNAGLLYAGRNQQLTAGGLLTNSGSIASVNNTHITAGKVTGSGLLGAGVQADGSLGTAGDLTVNADGVLQASGQNLAAGSATLTGSSVDLSGNQTGAANIAITARSGDVLTNKAVISASNLLAITANANNAQSLVNSQGQLVAGQLQLNMANLNNASGEIVQTGTGDTVITTNKLDNTAGRIAANSANLALNATVLTNINGKLEHAGAGVLAINAGRFDNQHGKITGNGKLDITAATFDHRNATTMANQLTVNAGNLDNRSGSLAQTGAGLMTVNATGQLDNTGGKIEGNGDALLKVSTLLNSTGRIVAAQDAELTVGSLDNTEGTVAAGRHLQLSGGDIDNTKGQLQAVAGNATLNVANLNNTAGNVFAGANLSSTLDTLSNTGSLYAAGNQSLAATGAIVNTGVIAAQGNTNLTAKTLDSSASSLLGAGMQADGKLGSAGDLTINTTQTLAAHGQNLAAGKAGLTGVSVDLSGSQTSAASIGLSATQGDVSTNKAVVTTPGALNITTNATLHNTEGTVQAGQLDLHLGNLDNAKGTVIQAGTGDTVIQTGKLDNNGGRIAVNSANLTLGAATLTNAGGKIEHAGSGTLAITAATLQGAGGSIVGNGAVDLKASLFDHANATATGRSLNVQADSLSNRGGHLLQTGGGGMTVAVTGQLDNANGEIAGNGTLSVQTGSLDNTKGKITSATSADIAGTGALVNIDGVIAAATDLHLGGAIDNTRGLLQAGTGALRLDAASVRNAQGTLSAGTDITAKVSGDVLNAGVLYAGRNQTLDIGGVLSNTGSLAALGNTTITAGSLSGNGLLAAGMRADGSFAAAGDLTVTARGALQAGGQNTAAGQLQLTGASVDVGGGQTSAANIGLTALAGNVTTSKAVVSTNGLLAITANAANGQALVNQGGSLSAGQLSLRVANLDNAKGTLIQTGAGDTVIETGTLDNTGGRIAVNSAKLRLQAGDLTNVDGKIEHAGKGVLDIRATNLYGQRGQLTGNGALQVAAAYIDHRNASLLAQQVGVSAGSLDNREGQITQLGTSAATIQASTRLDNSGGKIEANGNVRVETGELLNDHGRIASAQDVNVAATGKLDNSSGVIVAGRDLTLAGGKVDNTLGQLQSAGGNAQLTMDELLNDQGSIVASGNLTTTAGSARNSGSLFAGGEQVLKVSGALENAGVILAQGNNTISANSVNSGAASLIGAGVKADGSLQTSGNLQVTTMQALGAHGQVLAAGNAVLSGGSVDLGGSRSSAGNISLTATIGDVSTSGAVVTTPGALTITSGQAGWNNQRGDVSAGQLAVGVGNLNNQQGSIVQTGTGNTVIELTSPAGVLDNTGGRIAVNSANLGLKAGTLTNTDGKIEHAGSGTLSLQAAQLNDQRGQITGNGALVVTAGTIDHRNASTIAQQISVTGATLDNAGGNLTQLGKGDTSIQLATSLDNRGGTIASNGNTTIVAPTLYNQGGKLQAAGTANLTVTANNVLDNSHGGAIAGGGNVVLGAGNLLNQGGSSTAGGQLTANVAQALNNAGGLLAATGNMTVNAASVDNSAGGKLASVQGQLQVISTGATVNNGGTLQAGGDIILRNSGLWNGQGTIAGANVTLDTQGQVFNNTQGTLAGAGTVNLQTGILDNDGGLLQSGGAMNIDTHGNALLNTNAGAYAVRHSGSAGGISSGAGLSLYTGSWNNAGGYLGAAGNVTGSVGQLDNRGGQIVGKSALDLTLSGLQNQGGQIQVLGNLGLNAGGGSVNNQQGLIRSGAAVTVTGGAIDNASTLGANQGIEGIHVTLNSANVSNVQGAVRADGNLAINSAGIVNNTQGMLSAGGALALQDSGPGRGLAVTNTAGTIIGGLRTDIRAGSLSGDGKVLSQQDMALDLAGNFTLNAGAEIMANRNADITIGGQLGNAGKIQALSMLTLGAANFDNTSTGDINAGTTRINVGGVLNNRGVIDGISTQLNVGTLNNMGTGRIYGDHLSIAGATVNNDVEGGVAATIAARDRLDIGVTTLNNREHGLIFSGGDMAIGGYLDGNRIATGWAGSVTNASATIEALGSLDLGANQVNVLNNHLVFDEGRTTTENISEFQSITSTEKFVIGDPGFKLLGEYTFPGAYLEMAGDQSYRMSTPDGQISGQFTHREVIRTTSESIVVSSDPGRIIAGSNIKINSNSIINNNSHILAGGLLDIDKAILHNTSTQGKKIVRESGTSTFYSPKAFNGKKITVAVVTPIESTITLPASSAGTSRNEGNANTGGQGTKPGSVVKNGVGGAVERIGGAEMHVRTSVFSAEAAEIRKADVSGQGTSHVDSGSIVQKTDRAGNPLTDAAVGVTPGSKLDGATGVSAATGAALNHVSTGAAGSVAAQGAAVVSGAHGATGSTRAGDAARTVAVDMVSAVRVDTASGAGQHGAGVDAALLTRSSVGSVTVVSGGNGPGGAAHGGVLGQAGEVGTVNSAQLSSIAGGHASSHTGLVPVAGAGIAADQVQGKGGPGGIADAGTLGRAGEIATLASAALAGVNGAQASAAIGLNPLQDAAIGASTGSAAHAGAVGGVGQVRMNGITQVKLGNPSTRAQVVRTTGSTLQVPNASLYQISSTPSSRYLVETDPRFASYREWTGSDYLLNQVKNDPAVTQKRLGDGFYEQRLVREQVAALTGQRFVGDYSNDEQQYKALMDQGIAFAKQWDLRPGIALTAEQMAGLTSDIVWLVEQEVVLADGSTQKVLAPQVYVRVREGDIDGQGGLLAGKEVNLNLEGDLTNSGTIAGRTIVKLNAENIENLGGRITGDAISAHARNDLNNISGTISANSELQVSAGRDINVKTSTLASSGSDGKNSISRTSLDNLAGLYVTGNGSAGSGNLLVSAGRDVTIAGASVVNADTGGGIGIAAGRDIAVTTVSSGSEFKLAGPGQRYTTDTSSKETASTIASAGDIRLSAGDNIQLKAANVQAAETLQLSAERNIDISTARDTETRQSWYGSSSTKSASQGSELGGKQVVMLAGNDINNAGGQVIASDKLIASAGRDINIVTTTVSNASKKGVGNSETSTVVDKVAGLYVTGTGEGNTLIAQAGRDLTLTGGVIANAGVNGQTSLVAGNNLTLNTVTVASTHDEVRNADNYRKESKTGEVGSQIIGAGNVNLQAGNDLLARAADVQAGGALALVAGNDISLLNGVATDSLDVASKVKKSGTFSSKTTTTHDLVQTSTALGTSLTGNTVDIVAGHDLKVAGSSVLAHEAANLMAKNDISIESVGLDGKEIHSKQVKKSGTFGLSKSLTSQADDGRTVTQAGSAVSGGSVTMVGGRDVAIKGSTVVADGNIDLTALRNLSIVSAENDKDTTSSSYSKKSGFIGSFTQPAFGTVKTTSDGKNTGVAQVGSQIASLGGNVSLRAGETYTQTASEVLATGAGANGGLPGDISIVGKNVLIKEAYNSNASEQHTTFSKVALGGTVNVPIVDAVKSIGSLAKAAEQTKDSRMQALAAVTLASKATDLAGMASKGLTNTAGIKISVSLGSSKSESDMHQSSSTVVGSAVNAAGNVSIVATGAGADSDLTVAGSKIAAGGNLTLFADDKINLLAAQNTATQTSKNSSSGSSIGVGYTFGGAQNGFSLDIAANQARGKADGTDNYYTNTYVTAGKTATVISGGDTTLQGAILAADAVKGAIGGNLNIISLQDTSTYASKSSSAGFNMSLCIPPACYGASSIGGSVSKSKAKGDFASVTEQSGIKAGDGGFQINVAGNTDLQAGVIASSGKAITDGKNSLITGTLTTSELQNKDQHSASGFSLSGSVSGKLGDQTTASTAKDKAAVGAKSAPGGTGGIGNVSGSQSSTTNSGISGGTILITDAAKQQALSGKTATEMLVELNRDVRSDQDQSGALTKSWDGRALDSEVQSQIKITQAFNDISPKLIANFAASKSENLRAMADVERDPEKQLELINSAKQWEEGGIYRTALHSVNGLLTGGVAGALGAGAVANAATTLSDLQKNTQQALEQQGLSPDAAKMISQGIAEVTASSVGALVGGGSGASTAIAADTNNRQLHEDALAKEKTFARNLAEKANLQGLRNSQGQAYTASDFENALRSANNKNLGETWQSSMIVGIDKNTKSTDLYDTTGMVLTGDGNGNHKMVQTGLSLPSRNVMDFIKNNDGGNYSWDNSAPPPVTSPKFENFSLPPGWSYGGAASSGMDTLKMGIPLPDYLSLSASTKYLNFGVSISINLHNGTIYAGGFVPDAASNGATATFGYLPSSYEYNRSREDKAKSTDSLMTGASAGLSGCAYGACLGINHAIGGETAKEVGIGFGGISKVPAPSINVNVGASGPINQ